MAVHEAPSVLRASGRTGRWYAQIDSGAFPIRGTGTGSRASWIVIDDFEIVARPRDRLEFSAVTLRLTKKPDLATPHIYRASVVGTPLNVRIELVDGARTVLTATMEDARIVHMVILPNGREQFDLVASRVGWTMH